VIASLHERRATAKEKDEGLLTSVPGFRRDLSIETVDALEELIFAALGVTSRTLADTPSAARLTLTQWRLLALLERVKSPVRLGELAAAAAMSVPSASRLVARLATRGLVQSLADPSDARALRIGLTAEGRRVTADVISDRRALVARSVERTDLPSGHALELSRVAACLISESRSSLE
jgi:DNA-binding MarR family transcriptional regulator